MRVDVFGDLGGLY